MDEEWPGHPKDHIWGDWALNTAPPIATQYRKCTHTMCNAYELREHPWNKDRSPVDHFWPTEPEEHVWGPWLSNTTGPKPTRYRQCVHPACHAYETEDQPKG